MVHLNIFPRHAYIALSLQAQKVTAITLRVTAVALVVFAAYADLWAAVGAAVGALALAFWVNRAMPVEEPRAAPIVPAAPPVPAEPVGVMRQVVADLMAGSVRERVEQLRDTTFTATPPLQRRSSVPDAAIPPPPPLGGGIPPPPPVPDLTAVPKTPYRQPSAGGHKKAATLGKPTTGYDPNQIKGVQLRKRAGGEPDTKKKEETPEALRRVRAREARRAGSWAAVVAAPAPAQLPAQVAPKKVTPLRSVPVAAAPVPVSVQPPVLIVPPRVETPPRSVVVAESDGEKTPVKTPVKEIEEEKTVVRRGSLFEKELEGIRQQMAPGEGSTRAARTPHRLPPPRRESQGGVGPLDLAVSPSPPRPDVRPSRRGMSVHFQRQAKQLRHVSPPSSARGASAGHALFGELDPGNLTPRSLARQEQLFDSPPASDGEE